MRSVKVELGERSYEVVVGSGLIDKAADYLSKDRYEHLVAIVDGNVDELYAGRLVEALEQRGPVTKVVVEPGETSKSLDKAGSLLDRMAEAKVRRQDVVVTLGGGVVSDLGGFVASVYQRGISVVHVPTTLLGQVDAAIGGKTGVNLQAGKNLVGTFWQPDVVLNDVSLLSSLPDREFRSGLAEVVKYGLCYEPDILDILEAQAGVGVASWPEESLEEVVYRSAAIKARVVSADETDFGARTMLNYGHTLGHALEAVGGYERWLHGEAIAVGMMFAAYLARNVGLLDVDGVVLHRRALEAAGLPVAAQFDPQTVEAAWGIDKKYLGGQRWVLLDGIAKPVIRSDVTGEQIRAAMAKVSWAE